METENQDLEGLFLRKKPARLLINIKNEDNPYASILAKKIDCTYAHTVKLLQKMQDHGLIELKKTGRVKFIKLTNSGNSLAEDLENLLANKLTKIENLITTTEEIE